MSLLGTMIKGRGRIKAAGEGIHPLTNAPTWRPVMFEDGTFAILGESGQPISFDEGAVGKLSYDESIKHAAAMPSVSAAGSGWIKVRVTVPDGRTLIIRHGYGFGKEDSPNMHMWEDSEAVAEDAR